MFRGHYRHSIDAKGRLSIPSRFRDVLASGWGDKLVIVPNGRGLEVYPLQWWEELEGKIDALPKLDPDARTFRYKFLSQGQEVELDPQGRIQVSADYRTRAGLVRDVVILGMQKMFEVWDADRWSHFDSESGGGTTLDDTRARLAEKGV